MAESGFPTASPTARARRDRRRKGSATARLRHALGARAGTRLRYRGTVTHFSWGDDPGGPPFESFLLLDIRDFATNKRLADHLWFPAGKWSVGLQVGDRVAFDAIAKPYRK